MLFGEALRNVGGLFFCIMVNFFCLFLGEMKKMFFLCFIKQTQTHIMNYETILSNLEAANEFVIMQGFAPLPESILLNTDNRVIDYNKRGQMMMARVFSNWQEVGNVVIQVKIVD